LWESLFLNVEEILVVRHLDCGIVHLPGEEVLEKLKQRGITEAQVDAFQKQGIHAEIGCPCVIGWKMA